MSGAEVRKDGAGGPASCDGAAKVIVLDRDGTIVIDRHYLQDPAGLAFLPGAAEGLRRLHELGYRLVIITNQSGVGRGFFSIERMHEINQRLVQMVREIGAEICGIYCCPHRPDERCECRKPEPKLLYEAGRELHFDPKAAIVIGDKRSDIELGQRVGAITILISQPSATAAKSPVGPQPCQADYLAGDLQQAAVLIERLDLATAAGTRPLK